MTCRYIDYFDCLVLLNKFLASALEMDGPLDGPPQPGWRIIEAQVAFMDFPDLCRFVCTHRKAELIIGRVTVWSNVWPSHWPVQCPRTLGADYYRGMFSAFDGAPCRLD